MFTDEMAVGERPAVLIPDASPNQGTHRPSLEDDHGGVVLDGRRKTVDA
jgi:hypothetical protein